MEDYPARKANCFKCNRNGHFGSQCLSATVSAQEVEVDSGEEHEVFLGAVGNSNNKSWFTKIGLQGNDVAFKLDTGAEVTVISEEVFKNLEGTKLQTPSKALYGPSHQKLDVVGEFEGTLTQNVNSHKENIFVVRHLRNNLLGLPAITALQLIQRVDSVAEFVDLTSITKQFPTVLEHI